MLHAITLGLGTKKERHIMEYTKGKWEIWKAPNGKSLIAANDKMDIIADVFGDVDEYEVNARLIAAAPELYEALKELSFYIRTNMGNARPIYEKAMAAISKVEGQ